MKSVKEYTLKQARKALPARGRTDNKTRGGKALVVAGSEGMYGAAVLCAKGAARVGAGYVTVLASKKEFPTASSPDFLTLRRLAKSDFSQYSAVAVGPGLKNDSSLRKHLQSLKSLMYQKVVIDATALDVVAKMKSIPPGWILTPHEGELGRMLNVSSQMIRGDRQKYVRMAQAKWGCIVLLKGHRTLVADGHSIYQIQSGNPSLAKAGTGDVLTGIILGLMSQGLTSIQASLLGAFIHGKTADDWIRDGNDHLSLMASDLILKLPQALRKIRGSS